MRRFINALAVGALLVTAAPMARAQEMVRVEGDGGFDLETVRTLQSITEAALRQHGVVDRHFVLRVGRLGRRIPLSLEETARDGTPARVASLAASEIEEADVVIPRLVEAVLSRKDVADTARFRTVVEVETEEVKKLPSERHWTFGAAVAPGGLYSAYTRETAHWRVELTLQGTGKVGETGSGAGFFGVGAAWLVSDGSFSPFIGGGAGMVWVDDQEGTGVHLEAGMEMLRLHRMRFIIAADVIIPGFDPSKNNRFADAKRVYPSLQLRVGF